MHRFGISHRTVMKRTVLFAAIVSASTGCKFLSQTAHHVGTVLDPDLPPVVEEHMPLIPNHATCQTCDSQTCNSQESIYPAQHVTQLAAPDVRQDIAKLSTETDGLRARMESMEEQLVSRTNELIDTRAEYQRTRREIATIREDMARWQGNLASLREKLQQREEQRRAQLSQLTTTLSRVLEQNTAR